MKVDSSKVQTLLDVIEQNISKYTWKYYETYDFEQYKTQFEIEGEKPYTFVLKIRRSSFLWRTTIEYTIEYYQDPASEKQHWYDDYRSICQDDMIPAIRERLTGFHKNIEAAVVAQGERREREAGKDTEDSLLNLASKLKANQ